ncbi:MAG: MalY/PatB family protein [Lachnospiraceae bacterium]|nr:MalY/PatB family protein [Lachnospiraceae bacterium]
MAFDFDRKIDRKCTNDLKWHSKAVESYLHVPVPDEMIPMWLADMDFACPPGVIEAMKARCDKEIYGYCAPMANTMKAVCFWQKERNGLEVNPAWIGVLPSVVAGINVAIRAFTDEGDGVIIQQPVYDPFEKLVCRCRRTVVNNGLTGKDNYYEMDFDLLEKQASDPKNKLMVLCSPHNPVGRVWRADELERVMDICIRNHVLVVVDEIHSDLIFYGNHFHSLLGLNEAYRDHVVMLTSPGKTFNVAGLKAAVSIIPNPELKAAFEEMVLNLSLDVKNTFGIESLSACYTKENEEWLEELKAYIQGNIDFVYDFVREHMPMVKFRKPEGTYLVWLDFSETGLSDDVIMRDVVLGKAVICVPGTWFGPGGEGHIRFNTAGPRSLLKEALERFEEALKEKGIV